jgi:ppGpp synthetase/RelA/SpoT-type nucleotidyltranferase
MPEVDSRVGADTVDQVLQEFDRRKDQLTDLSSAVERLIRIILEEEAIPIQSVQARVKDRDKLRSKYCKPEKDYKKLDDISDLVGLRIITYYSDRIDQIAAIIAREFDQRRPPEDKRLGKPETFGYSAIHMDCAYLQIKLDSTEYRRFAGAQFEIQITIILGHAWAEMHHPWYDELNSPIEELRRFHRLAAVLELAEQEFLEIRKKRDQRELIASVRVAAKAPEIPITSESLKAFIEEGSSRALDTELAEILGGTVSTGDPNLNLLSKSVISAGLLTIQSLEDKLNSTKTGLKEFVTRCVPIWGAARGNRQRVFTKGLCVFHLATLLSAARGEQSYRATIGHAKISLFPLLDIAALVQIAERVAREFHI